MEGDCTQTPVDWIGIIRALNESKGRLLGPPRSTDKTTLIVK